jgi:hypothetical protein
MLHSGDAPVGPETLGSLHDTFHVRLVLLVWLARPAGRPLGLVMPASLLHRRLLSNNQSGSSDLGS